MSDRFNPAELKLRDDAEKVIRDAKNARTDVDPGCLGRLRGMEKRFSFALDLDQTAPTQIGIMKQFGDQALKLDILYDKMIRNNQETMDIAKQNIEINFQLMVLHSIVALGKLCEAVLVVCPATSKAAEVLKALKTTISSGKDIIEANKMSAGGSQKGKTLEGLLKNFGDQGKALAELIGGIVDVEGGRTKVRRSKPRNWLEARRTSENSSRVH